jgi:hypothetical protein
MAVSAHGVGNKYSKNNLGLLNSVALQQEYK